MLAGQVNLLYPLLLVVAWVAGGSLLARVFTVGGEHDRAFSRGLVKLARVITVVMAAAFALGVLPTA